ncbi:hypothetical protein E3W21_08810 [Pseudomonas sp. F01002]|nr:hypothetical protein E3W21_08810 [Pseudomonas sp. F01002]
MSTSSWSWGISIGTSAKQWRDATAVERTGPVGAAAGCDLLIFGVSCIAENQKIAACGSSYSFAFA